MDPPGGFFATDQEQQAARIEDPADLGHVCRPKGLHITGESAHRRQLSRTSAREGGPMHLGVNMHVSAPLARAGFLR
jgi:hypothetical protein